MEIPIDAVENLARGLFVAGMFLTYVVILMGIALSNRDRRIRELEAGYHEAQAKLLHCQAYDETASPPHHEFGEHLVWEGLSKAEKAYWMALVDEEPEPEPEPELRHVCGLQGVGRGIGSWSDTCPACEAHYERNKK